MSIEPDDIAANLPPPRADEPVSLRQDIIDELADHLQSAARAEQLRNTGTPEEIRAVVLERFGPPGKIAQRLWRDAIRENLTMSQKLMTILAAASTVACLAMALLVWQSMREGREALRDFLSAQNTTNQKMIDQLAAMAMRAGNSGTSWMPFRVRLVDESGKPVAGTIEYETTAGGVVTSSTIAGTTINKPFTQSMKADAEGWGDFGAVPGGVYHMTARVALSDHVEQVHFEALIGPGRNEELKIICPTTLPPPRTVKFQIDPPKGVDPSRVYYRCQITPEYRALAGRTWIVNYADHHDPGPSVAALIDSSGHICGAIGGPGDAGERSALIPANVPLKPIPPGFLGYSFAAWNIQAYTIDSEHTPKDSTTPALIFCSGANYTIESNPQPDGVLPDGVLLVRATLQEQEQIRQSAQPTTNQTTRAATPKHGEILKIEKNSITAMPFIGPIGNHRFEPVTYKLDDNTRVVLLRVNKVETAPDGTVASSYESRGGTRDDLKVGLRAMIEGDGETATRIVLYPDESEQKKKKD